MLNNTTNYIDADHEFYNSILDVIKKNDGFLPPSFMSFTLMTLGSSLAKACLKDKKTYTSLIKSAVVNGTK